MSCLGNKLLLVRVVSNAVLGCINRGSSKLSQVMIFVLALERALMEYCVQFGHLQFKKDIGKLKWVQRRAMRTIKNWKIFIMGRTSWI